MARERELGRLQRLKLYANKMMDRIDTANDDTVAGHYTKRLRETYLAIEELEHVVAVSEVRETRDRGINVPVPTKRYDLGRGGK